MKKRGKVLLSLAACTLCLCLLITGIYASATITFTTTSTLNFTPTNAYTAISINTYQGNVADESSFTQLEGEGYTLSEIKNFTANADGFPDGSDVDPNGFKTESGSITEWQAGEVILYLAKPTVRYEVTIYNYSGYAIKFTPSYTMSGTNQNLLTVLAHEVNGTTVKDYNLSSAAASNSAVTIAAPTGTTATSVTFRVDVTVDDSNENAVDASLALNFAIERA